MNKYKIKMFEKIKKTKKVYPPNRRGFSIIESVIGICIVGSIFTTFLAILPQAINNEAHALRTIVATSLAQEGIEMVRNLRDNNLKSGCDAFEASDDCIFPNERSVLPFTWNIVAEETFEGKAIDMPDKFKREIYIVDQSDSMKIFSLVSYNGDEMAKIETTLYNWGQKK